jgi:hypothetical protein
MFGDKNNMHINGKQNGIVDMIWRELRRERAGEQIAITHN